MSRLSETAFEQLIKGGETNTVEFKRFAPRAVDLAERLCGMANARGGVVIIGVEDSTGKSWVSLMIVLGRHWMLS